VFYLSWSAGRSRRDRAVHAGGPGQI